MNIIKLTKASILKRKGSNITFILLTLIASFMLAISLNLFTGIPSFYDKKVEELNAPQHVSIIERASYKNEFYDFASAYDDVNQISLVDTLVTIGDVVYENARSTFTIILYDYDETVQNSFYKPRVIDQGNNNENSIILPVSYKYNGIKTNDIITIELTNNNYEFIVNGFFEDAITGASTTGAIHAFLSSECFVELISDQNYVKYVSMFMTFNSQESIEKFEISFAKYAKLNDNEAFMLTYGSRKAGSTMFINLVSVMLLAFSFIILGIAFIVVNFSIKNNIAEDISMIGTLKALGYKNKNLRLCQLMQYTFLALIGIVLGLIFNMICFGFLGNIIASLSGLLWIESLNIMSLTISFIVILGLTFIFTYIGSKNYKKIVPILAITNQNEKKNIKKLNYSISKDSLPLNLSLATKRFFSSIKNSITLSITVALLVFFSLFVNVSNYNLNSNRQAMINMVGIEMSELFVQATNNITVEEVNQYLKNDNRVKSTLLYGSNTGYIDDYQVAASAVEDYSKLTINTIAKGRYPNKDNEVAIGAVSASKLSKKIGDTIDIQINDLTVTYQVVGIIQNIANGGEGFSLTFNAMLNHNDKFKMNTIYVYLNENVNTKDYYNELQNVYGNNILIANVEIQMDTILSSMGDPIQSVTMIMIVVALIIIGFVIFLMINTLLKNQKKEFGIMKAIGYKNHHLVFQIILSYLPSIVTGVVLGLILTFVATNPLLSIVFSSMGLVNTYFIIPILDSFLIGSIMLVTILTLMYVISLRLGKIQPIKLISQ